MGHEDSVDSQDPHNQNKDKKQKSRRPASEHTWARDEDEDGRLTGCRYGVQTAAIEGVAVSGVE
jgi:hypothetical protein